ncbi:MAG TPA: glycosyltransferase family 1 protein [Rhabdochlamydiaceae bacterium]|jgi:glycosyltransferase involved in cell wall biosynthesis
MRQSVCIDARLISAPGIGTYLKNLLLNFKQTPWKWFALALREQEDAFSSWDYVEPIFVDFPIYSIKEQIALPFAIPRVDLFWSPHYNIPCFPIRASKRLTTIHDALHLALSSNLRFKEKVYARSMMPAALRLSDSIITCSIFSKIEIETYTGIRSEKMRVIPYGVDHARFYPSEESAASEGVLQRYGVQAPFLLFVGSCKKHKNLRGLLKAFSRLIEQSECAISCVIIGSAQSRHCEDVKQLCIDFKPIQHLVHFLGYVPEDDLPHFYRCAELFVFPSLYEGFGFPPLEAMSSACPALVSRIPALSEVCGEGAIYCDPYDPGQIAACMHQLLQNRAQRNAIAKKGWERSRGFCWKKCALEHISVIERLLV